MGNKEGSELAPNEESPLGEVGSGGDANRLSVPAYMYACVCVRACVYVVRA